MFSNVFFNQFLQSFFAELSCKNCTLPDVKLHLCIVLVEKVNKFFSIATETAMKTRNMDWPLSLCGYGGPPFVAIQFFPRYLRLLLITFLLLRFSLCLLSSAFQVFSVISLCIFAHFFNCLVKLFTELIRCLMFQNASFVHLLEIPLSPIRALCPLTLCVGLDVAWEFGWIIFLQKMPLVLFLHYIEPSCYIFSAVVFLNIFLEYFFARLGCIHYASLDGKLAAAPFDTIQFSRRIWDY